MQRKTFSAEFKAKIALAALKGDKTINAIAGEHDVHPNPVATWKKEALAGWVEIFSGRRGRKPRPAGEIDPEALYSQIGRLKVELDWLTRRRCGQPQADRTVDAADGAGGDLPLAQLEPPAA